MALLTPSRQHPSTAKKQLPPIKFSHQPQLSEQNGRSGRFVHPRCIVWLEGSVSNLQAKKKKNKCTDSSRHDLPFRRLKWVIENLCLACSGQINKFVLPAASTGDYVCLPFAGGSPPPPEATEYTQNFQICGTCNELPILPLELVLGNGLLRHHVAGREYAAV